MKCENSTLIEQIKFLNVSSKRSGTPRASDQDLPDFPAHDGFVIERAFAKLELLEDHVDRDELAQGDRRRRSAAFPVEQDLPRLKFEDVGLFRRRPCRSRAGSMLEPPRGADAMIRTSCTANPARTSWLRPLQKDWKRTLTR